MGIANLVQQAIGTDTLAVRAYDGSSVDPVGAVGTIDVRSADAVRRFVTSPGELGLGRAFVAGDIDFEGDVFAALAAVANNRPRTDPRLLAELARSVGVSGLRPLPPPPEEV